METKVSVLQANVKLTSVERRVLDLESEAMRCLGSIPTGGIILSLDFFLFSCSKENIPILAFSYSL